VILFVWAFEGTPPFAYFARVGDGSSPNSTGFTMPDLKGRDFSRAEILGRARLQPRRLPSLTPRGL